MMQARALTTTLAFLCSTAAAAPLVTYQSPCECHDNHGKRRWAEKNDPEQPPTDARVIQAVTPSDIFNWQDPTEYLVPSSERIWSEQKWYALTGRVVDLRAEEDGDLHIAVQDVTGDKPGAVVVEIPAKPQWCEIRTTIFSWRCPKKDWKPLAIYQHRAPVDISTTQTKSSRLGIRNALFEPDRFRYCRILIRLTA